MLSKPDSLEAKAGRGSPSVCSSGLGGTDILLSWEGRDACRTPKCSSNSVGMENAPLTLGAHLRRRQDWPAQGPFSTAAQHPPQKEIFLPRRRSIKGPGNIPCGCSRNLSPPPPVLRCSASWKGDTGPTSESLPRRSSTFKRGPNLLGQAARSRPSASPAGDRAGRALPALGRPQAAPPGPKLRQNFNFAPGDIAVGGRGG